MSTPTQHRPSIRQRPDESAGTEDGSYRYLVVIWSDEPEVRVEDAREPALRRAATEGIRSLTAA